MQIYVCFIPKIIPLKDVKNGKTNLLPHRHTHTLLHVDILVCLIAFPRFKYLVLQTVLARVPSSSDLSIEDKRQTMWQVSKTTLTGFMQHLKQLSTSILPNLQKSFILIVSKDAAFEKFILSPHDCQVFLNGKLRFRGSCVHSSEKREVSEDEWSQALWDFKGSCMICMRIFTTVLCKVL